MEGDSRNPRVSLLKKYDIPIDHLTYEYIEKCRDKKELERIIRILRSGEEGMYPYLVKFAEEHLKNIAPDSRVLRVEAPVLTKDSLSSDEWKKVEEELLSWENDMKVMDKSLEFEKHRLENTGNKNLPEVRKVSCQIEQKPKPKSESKKIKIETNRQNERIRSGDYTAWDKFDVDKELLKLDVEEERKAEINAKVKREIMKQKKEELKIEEVPVATDSYSTMEQQILATQAKDRGNECFKANDLINALKYYGISIKLHPSPQAYNNRAMTYLKLKKYEEALIDCNQVLKLEPNNVKAFHRRSTAYQNIPKERYNELALHDLNKIIQLEPNNKVAQADLQTLKKKLNIEDVGRKFRMPIQDLSSEQKPYERKSCWNLGNINSVEKLPLTYYGPSTSTFQCEPQSMTHRMLSGPTLSGRVICKCNSNSPRQNPLCQKCGEKMCRPKPPVKGMSKQQPSVKSGNDVKNRMVKKNEVRPEQINANEKSKPDINELNERSRAKETLTSKYKMDEVNETSKLSIKEIGGGSEVDEIMKSTQKDAREILKSNWDNFINSKFDGSKKKPRYVNNSNNGSVIITEIFDEDSEEIRKNKSGAKINETEKHGGNSIDAIIDNKTIPDSTQLNVDEENANANKLIVERDKISEPETEKPNSGENERPDVKSTTVEQENKINDLKSKCAEEKTKFSKIEDEQTDSNKLEEKNEIIGGSEEENKKETKEPEPMEIFKQGGNEVKNNKSNKPERKSESNKIETNSGKHEIELCDIDNQSLPGTSSQTDVKTETKKRSRNRRRKPKERREIGEFQVGHTEPVKITQAPKYIKPTSAEPKNKEMKPVDNETEIRIQPDSQFKNFVPNLKCTNTAESGVLKTNYCYLTDNRLELQAVGDTASEKVRSEKDEEGNKENIIECKESGDGHSNCLVDTNYGESIDSAFEFMKNWEALKKTDETYVRRAEVLRKIKPKELGKVIGNKLDSEMLKSMLECLEKHFVEAEPKKVVEFLQNLPKIPRFGIVSLFLNGAEKKIIERLVEAAERKGFKLEQETRKALTI